MADQEPLGREYLLHEEIGRGAVAVVRRATRRTGGAEALAAKLLRPEYASDRRVRELFLREEAALRDLDHPNIVGLRDLVVEGETLALIMDLVDGPNLRRYLEFRGGRLPAAEVAAIAGQTAAALAAAHAQGVVHLDLKPENILVVPGAGPPRVRITDFGVAVLLHDAERLAPGGTPGYTAPEIFIGGPPTAAADVWSLGVLIAELSTGSPSFDPGLLPPHLAAVTRDCLASDPRQRPPARRVAAYLRNAGGNAGAEPTPIASAFSPPAPVGLNDTRLRPGVTPPAPPPPPEPVAPPSRWRRGPLITLGAVALIAATLAGINAAASAGERGSQAIQQISVPPKITPQTTDATVEPTAGITTTPVAERLRVTLAGKVEDGAGTLAISIRDGRAIAYICDGQRVESWLQGTAKAGKLALKGKDGSTITGTFDADSAEGDVTVAGDTHAFEVGKVKKGSGLYRTAARVRGAEVEGSWIVLDDGSQVGVLSRDGVPGPAPSLDVTGGTVTIDGSTLGTTSIDVDSGEGF
ncbi:serine/threonine-protein kinase [Actinoplanes lutulentus]|uniref:non-specific serine/threonine protein kinase n=1 Tax=Actinoplanes lutulentus TaxID=1287878 RepID=A0A327Z1A7_9ACTN|nr:serine/threonine-protein kinase [Actinoplanes lutulentus]MBB2943578.1 serine/threonine-protein kinase [Actinoplanes lutulentus]RAK27444.1 serine/threonine-protein kinase [Actinoplanes lutulentus]